MKFIRIFGSGIDIIDQFVNNPECLFPNIHVSQMRHGSVTQFIRCTIE